MANEAWALRPIFFPLYWFELRGNNFRKTSCSYMRYYITIFCVCAPSTEAYRWKTNYLTTDSNTTLSIKYLYDIGVILKGFRLQTSTMNYQNFGRKLTGFSQRTTWTNLMRLWLFNDRMKIGVGTKQNAGGCWHNERNSIQIVMVVTVVSDTYTEAIKQWLQELLTSTTIVSL